MRKLILVMLLVLINFKAFASDELINQFNDLSVPILNEELRKSAATSVVMQESIDAISSVVVGSMMLWPTNTAPEDYLLCYGQAVSRIDYSDLFAIIGTQYGVGDGTTTFNIPDMRGRFALGKDNMGGSSANRVTDTDADNLGGADGQETHTLTVGEMPSHTHGYSLADASPGTGSGAGSGFNSFTSSSTASAGSGQAHNNMPPYITLNFIIKT